MSVRGLALVVVLALVPTVEALEQGAHALEHLLAGDVTDHDAHHEEHDPGDEHGCTQLVHVCGVHQGLGLAVSATAPSRFEGAFDAAEMTATDDLRDLLAEKPPHRPPIG